MCDLDATEEQLDFPVIYGSAKNNWMGEDWKTPTGDILYLLDQIVEHIPAPQQLEGTPQMLITSLVILTIPDVSLWDAYIAAP